MSAVLANDPVRLSVNVGVGPERVTIALTLTNTLDEPVFVRAHPDDGRRAKILRHRAYTWLEPTSDILLVDLLNPPPHPDIDVFRAVISISRKLEPGSVLAHEIHLSRPVQEWNPYFPDPESAPWEWAQAKQLRVRTAWFPARGVHWIEAGPEPGTFWTQGSPYTLVEVVTALSEPIEICRRLDSFRRS